MEVPERTLYSGGSFPSRATDESLPIHGARMFTPGAAISGCKQATLGKWVLSWEIRNRRGEASLLALRMFLVPDAGPLAEKYTTVGAGLYFVTVTVGWTVATGFLDT
ncbi:hypothetical protein ACFX1R_044455 [Malus domestica]